MASENQERLIKEGLKHWAPSSPHRPPKYNLKLSRGKQFLATMSFCAEYAATYMIDLLRADADKTTWVNPKTITFEHGDFSITVEGDHLELLCEYKMTPKEKEWVPPEPYASLWPSYLTDRPGQPIRLDTPEAPVAPKGPVRTSDKHPNPQQVPKRNHEVSPPKKAKVSKDGLVSIGDIAEQMKVLPRDARQILRKTKTPKPDAGWAWPKSEVEKIKGIIKKGL